MRSANKNRLKAFDAKAPTEDWKRIAGRKMLHVVLYDDKFAEMARKPHIVGTPPEDAARYEAEATAYFVDLCRQHGEHRYADLILAESSKDAN
ncbi:hypothetical protein [Lacipirellula parvula]|uniref:Uncharacterized protein n=1 Tax=Lacipirellula parvula TaxID=2650471 RepID=A0A5K7X627_9BACT|nr:hypothetical protein [Lacipirellula parvula]BBO31958.1 hypothetical protein PLANPX_1570 [Lacipirellula parvula]